MANFATAIPLSRAELVREERQYQYYPTNDYQQYGNGYAAHPQYGQYPYDGQNGQYNQNQQEIFDICADRAMNFQNKNLSQLALIISGLLPHWPRPPKYTTTNCTSLNTLEKPPKGTPTSLTGLTFILAALQNLFRDKSFGSGIINKSSISDSSSVNAFSQTENFKSSRNKM